MSPLIVTIWALRWILTRIDGLLGRYLYSAIGTRIPGLGIVTLVLLLLVTGWATERALGSRLLAGWDGLLGRIPIVRRIYGAATRIVRTVFSGDERSFDEVVMVEYPADGRWAIGLVAAPAPQAAQRGKEERVTVFIPNSPNVAMGKLVVVPRSLVTTLDLTVEQALAFTLSAGTLTPDDAAPPVTPVRKAS